MPRADLGKNAARDAPRQGLTQVQPGAFVASTQPYSFSSQLVSLTVSHPTGTWYLIADSAMWLYELVDAPAHLSVAIPIWSELAIRPPVVCRRLSPSVLAGSRFLAGYHVVALEVAVIQWAKPRSHADVVRMVERVLRARLTSVPRLRARLRRGFGGSAAVRAALDELAGGSLDRDVRALKESLEQLGVSGLECEVRFTSATGASAYADLLHRPTMTVIEVDGVLDHLVGDRFLADRRRDRWMLRDHGARTLRVDVREVRTDLSRLAAEIAGLLLRPAA